MHRIRFPSGRTVPWPVYREMMLKRRTPAMAYDAAPAWLARDQAGGPGGPAKFDQTGGGSLSRPFIDATNTFLADHGLSEEDCQAVSAILEIYAAVAADAENLEMPDQQQIRVGGPRGPVGAADRGRRMAHDEFDMHGQARRVLARAMPLGDADRAFAARFPGAERIRTV